MITDRITYDLEHNEISAKKSNGTSHRTFRNIDGLTDESTVTKEVVANGSTVKLRFKGGVSIDIEEKDGGRVLVANDR